MDGGQRAAQQIRFAKMPARHRADSSPTGHSDPAKPDVMVTSPSKPSDGRRRTGSLGAVEAVKARARADTTTSSDMSSENEVGPSYFQRRQINKQAPKPLPMEDPGEDVDMGEDIAQDDSDAESIGSALSSDLGETVDSTSVLNAANTAESPSSSPIMSSPIMPGVGPINSRNDRAESPKRTRTLPPLQELPPARPISFVPPISLLSQALGAQNKSSKNPIQGFAALSGTGTTNPLWIKIYAPFSSSLEEPFEMPLNRTSKDDKPVIVAEAIGLALWRYSEEKLEPSLKPEQLNVNQWTLRLMDDGEVDHDFPALSRTRPITEYTSNNNKGARARSRTKPWDEFALIEASAQQFQENNRETPRYTLAEEEIRPSTALSSQGPASHPHPPTNRPSSFRSNVLLGGQPFASALTNMTLAPADKPTIVAQHATPRVDKLKTVRVRYFDLDNGARSTILELSADSYIDEILDQVCRKWGFEKQMHVLKVAGTNTVAPLDRTLEALGTRSDLELVKRKFTSFPTSMSGSPGSASPNAPLLLDIQGPSKKGKKGQSSLATMAQTQDMLSTASNFKKYTVTRKRLSSFAQGSPRTLIFDWDFMHILPAETAKSSYTKTSSIAFSDVLKCKVSTKHSKIIRLIVRRQSESKRYDFEARSAGEAQEIVDDITRETKMAKGS